MAIEHWSRNAERAVVARESSGSKNAESATYQPTPAHCTLLKNTSRSWAHWVNFDCKNIISMINNSRSTSIFQKTKVHAESRESDKSSCSVISKISRRLKTFDRRFRFLFLINFFFLHILFQIIQDILTGSQFFLAKLELSLFRYSDSDQQRRDQLNRMHRLISEQIKKLLN